MVRLVGLGSRLAVVVGAFAIAACGGDVTDGSFDGEEEGGAGTGEGAATAAGPDESGDGESSAGGTSPDSAQDESGDADDGGTGDGIDEGGSPSCLADCGPSGTCVLDDFGVPACECEAGYAAYGMRCLECTKSDGAAAVELQRAQLTVTVSINGTPAPQDEYERAHILLRDRASGDEILVGDTSAGALQVSVLPGTYDVMYDRILGGAVVPRNNSALIVEQLDIADSMELDIGLTVVQIHGRISLGGAVPPDDEYETGRLVLVDRATGDEFAVGETRNGEYSARIVPGAYEVHYRRVLGGSDVPRNGDAYFSDLVVSDKTDDYELDIDIPFVDISGSYLLDDAAAPDDEYETAEISLLDPDTGDEIMLGETADGTFSARVIPGAYEIVYDRKLGGSVVPINNDAVLRTVDVGATPAFDVDVRTAVVSGSFTLNGAPLSLAPGEDAIVSLIDTQTGDEIPLGHVIDGNFSRIVLPGTYDVSYGQLSAAGNLPANTGARLLGLVVEPGAAGPTTIEIGAATVSGTILLGGEVPPVSEFSDGRLYLRDAVTGDSVLLGNTRLGGYSGTVVPGTYDLVYVVETAGLDVPVNSEARVLESVVVQDGAVLNVDIPVFDLQGSIALGGQAPPIDEGDRAHLLLQDIQTQDIIFLAGTEAGAFSQTLTGGTYVVLYQALTSSGLMPANARAGVGCIQLSGE